MKSYIDLFKSRIPELLDTIINLMDQDVSDSFVYTRYYVSNDQQSDITRIFIRDLDHAIVLKVS